MTYSKFILFKTFKSYEDTIGSLPSGLDPIVFIEETKQLWFMGTLYSIGDPQVALVTNNGQVYLQIGNTQIGFETAGDALSIAPSEDEKSIIITSTALTSINTSGPLSWDNSAKVLSHNKSGVTIGSYGQTSTTTGASVISVPYITLDTYGHITGISTNNVTIRDYVDQQPNDTTNTNRNVLLGFSGNTNDESNPVMKASGLTYNGSTKTLNNTGGFNAGSDSTVNGNLTVTGGYIIGTVQGDVTGTATPKIHLSSIPEYGGASTNLYGHVKLQDTLDTEPPQSSTNSDANSATVTYGVAASPYMVWITQQSLENKITSLPTIGSITINGTKYSVTSQKQDVVITVNNGITATVSDDGITLQGTEVTAYDYNNNQSKLTNVDLSSDFVNNNNTISLNWTEL